eukprot:scaffold177670_cov18-Tisochrysis_lutea.AAC.2
MLLNTVGPRMYATKIAPLMAGKLVRQWWQRSAAFSPWQILCRLWSTEGSWGSVPAIHSRTRLPLIHFRTELVIQSDMTFDLCQTA